MKQEQFLRDDLRQRLFPGADGEQLSADDVMTAVQSLQGEIYRQVKGRRTFQVELAGHSYFVKWHDGVGWGEIFKNLISGRLPIIGARPEYLAIKRFHAVGLPTMQIAGFGTRGINPARRQSFLITDDLSPAVSLEDLCSEWTTRRPSFAFKLALIRAVADIAKTMHAHSIAHRDFYLCHFLLDASKVVDREVMPPSLNVIDLHRALLRESLSERWKIKDIGGLWSSAEDIGLTRTDYARFVQWYSGLPLRQTLQQQSRFWARVQRRAAGIVWRDRRKAVDRALKGIYRDGEGQQRVRGAWKFGVFRRRYDGPELRSFMAQPERWMQQAHMLKDGDSTTVVRLQLDGQLYVVKRYNLRNTWYALRRLFRPSRAWHCWRSSHLLEFAGIDSPAPVMMLEQRWGPLRRRAYFVSEYRSEPALTIEGCDSGYPSLSTQFDLLLTRMLRFRIVHGDMKITNFLAGNDGPVVLDLDATRRVGSKRRFARLFAKDLKRLLANWDNRKAKSSAPQEAPGAACESDQCRVTRNEIHRIVTKAAVSQQRQL